LRASSCACSQPLFHCLRLFELTHASGLSVKAAMRARAGRMAALAGQAEAVLGRLFWLLGRLREAESCVRLLQAVSVVAEARRPWRSRPPCGPAHSCLQQSREPPRAAGGGPTARMRLAQVLGDGVAPHLGTVAAALPAVWNRAAPGAGAAGAPGVETRLHGALMAVLTHLLRRLPAAAMVRRARAQMHVGVRCKQRLQRSSGPGACLLLAGNGNLEHAMCPARVPVCVIRATLQRKQQADT